MCTGCAKLIQVAVDSLDEGLIAEVTIYTERETTGEEKANRIGTKVVHQGDGFHDISQ